MTRIRVYSSGTVTVHHRPSVWRWLLGDRESDREAYRVGRGQWVYADNRAVDQKLVEEIESALVVWARPKR